MTADRYMALAHILMADTYASDGNYALFGCSEGFREWVRWNVIGFGMLALPQNQPNAPLYPAGGAPGSRPGALPHFGRPRYLGPPPRARSTAG